ncbi:MAG: ABC transporter permease [Clostridiales bacterium]|nr:ABC transporter permease [Clostridiales bacterium]
MDQQARSSRIGLEFAQEMKRQSQRERFVSWAPLAVLALLVLLFSLTAEGFFSLKNLQNVLNQVSIPLVMSMGMTFVILMGSTDLSAEGLGGFVGSVTALMVLNSKTTLDMGFLAVVIAMVASVLVSALSGLMHIKGKLPSFMVSYAVSNIMAGFAVLAYRGEPALIRDPFFTVLAQGDFLGIPYLTFIALGVFGVSYVLQTRTRFGSYVMAIGDNEAIARNIGINIDRTKLKVFLWLGVCIGLVGFMGAVRIGRGEVAIGSNVVFPAITAVVVGGTSLSGGKGGVVHSLLGAFIVTVINNALVLLGVSPYVQQAVQGIIIIVAVALSIQHGKSLIVK